MNRSNQRWTVFEKEYLENNYKTMSVTLIAEKLGRTERAVRHRLERLGHDLKPLGRQALATGARTNVWTDNELSILEGHLNATYLELAALLPNRTIGAIRRKARQHGRQLKEPRGYFLSHGRKHLYIEHGKSITEHRFVMEEHLGRKLEDGEIVHHVNLDKLDNRIQNLCLCPDKRTHMLCHTSLDVLVGELLELGYVKFDESTGTYLLTSSEASS